MTTANQKASVHNLPGASAPPNSSRDKDPEVLIPKHERTLSKLSKTEWKRISDVLEKRGLIADEYRSALHLYCQSYGQLIELETSFENKVKKYMEESKCDYYDAVSACSMVRFSSGHVQQHPVINQISKLRAQTLKLLKEFGLTPASVSKVRQSHNRGQQSLFGDGASSSDDWDSF